MRLSPCLNIVLLAAVAWLALRDHHPATQEPTTSQLLKPKSSQAGELPKEVKDNIEGNPEPFRWAQLESTNYLQYIANLRAIGCPEQTIHDLITAELRNYYAAQTGGSIGTGTSTCEQPWSTHNGKNQASSSSPASPDISARAEVVANALLGMGECPAQSNPGTSAMGGAVAMKADSHHLPPYGKSNDAVFTDPDSATGTPPRLVEPIRIPQSLKAVEPADLRLSTYQLSVIQDLKNTFVQEVSAGSGDPNDPAYQALWRRAQRRNDDLLAGWLGRDFYVAFGTYAHAQFENDGQAVQY